MSDIIPLAIETEILRLEAAAAEAETPPDFAWLPVWYLGRVAQIEGKRQAIRKFAERLIGHCDSMEAALMFRWGKAFRLAVEADIPEGRKSVTYPTGKAGLRRRPDQLQIADEKAAKAWALENAPEALDVKLARKTPLMEHFRETGEVPPGCELIPEHDEFFPAVRELSLEDLRGMYQALEYEEKP